MFRMLVIVAGLAPFTVSTGVFAESWPVKPLRLISPYPPGGGIDSSARIVSQALTEQLGQQVVVETRAGASGRIGTEVAAKSPPDGYTLVLGSVAPNAIIPALKVSSKKPGYLVLIDVDATGHLTQLYPNTTSLARTNRANANYVKPGSPFTIPLASDPYAGVRYVVSPPNGRATIVGILSPLPVQILDLPDVPAELVDKPEKVLSFLSKRTGELRILDNDNQLREARWSFDAKPYVIQ